MEEDGCYIVWGKLLTTTPEIVSNSLDISQTV